MILPFLLALAGQSPPANWNELAPLPFRAQPVITPEMQAFVQREVTTRKCQPGTTTPPTISVDVAVLIDADDGIRTTVPRAIQCPTVEQYAAALVAGFARGNLLPRTASGEQWYRTTLSFALK